MTAQIEIKDHKDSRPVLISNSLYESLEREAKNRNCSTRMFHEKLIQEALRLLLEASPYKNNVRKKHPSSNLNLQPGERRITKSDLMTHPVYIKTLRQKIETILYPITDAVSSGTKAESNFLFTAIRSDAGRKLPADKLIFFLFVDLLDYTNLGKYETISWSIPIDYNGTAFLLERRNLEMGLFFSKTRSQEYDCLEIVSKITSATRVIRSYYESIASEAVN